MTGGVFRFISKKRSSYLKSPDTLRDQLSFEIAEIEKLLKTYRSLIDSTRRKPTLIEITAQASVLHAFYNGIEGLFARIAKAYREQYHESPARHKLLLEAMTRKTADRPAILRHETVLILSPYLAFRHFYRHAYSFKLDWRQLKPLVKGLDVVWGQVKEDLRLFVETIKK